MGLLLLRATLAVTVFIQAVMYLSEQPTPTFWKLLVGILAIVGAVFILLGFLTPVIGVLLLISGLFAEYFLFSTSNQISPLPLIYGVVLSAAVVLLGPGAFSVDAWLFGRREIIIPKN